MIEAKKQGKVHYGAAGTQRGGRVNFIGVGSSTKGNLGDEYYSQNTYNLDAYKKCIDKGIFPTHRGMKLSKDDKIRQHATQQLRTYWKLILKILKQGLDIDCKNYFKNEIESLKDMNEDGLVEIRENAIIVTKLGYDFAQFITESYLMFMTLQRKLIMSDYKPSKMQKKLKSNHNILKNL